MHSAFVLSLPSRLPLSRLSLSRPILCRGPLTPRPPHPKMSLPSSASTSPVLEGPISGRYGAWYFRQTDADQVSRYRLSLAAMSLLTTTAYFLSLTHQISPTLLDTLYFLDIALFTVALRNIHIYMKPMHKTLHALNLVGLLGSLTLKLSPLLDHSLVFGLYERPALLLATGWWLVALTGLFFKEAICFGRTEAVGLTVLVPVLAGGHFLGVLPEGAKVWGGGVFVALFALFAVRKLLQERLDDVGDLSVFDHLAKGGEL